MEINELWQVVDSVRDLFQLASKSYDQSRPQ